MRKRIYHIFINVLFVLTLLFYTANSYAQMPSSFQTPQEPEICGSGCPVEQVGGDCASTYAEWLANRNLNLWIKDPEVVALGQNAERGKQFLNWVLNHKSIDNHPTIMSVWSFSRNVTYFLLILVAVLIGVGIIIGQRNNFNFKIDISGQMLKLALWILYVTFSATLVLLIIQLSDVVMDFFIKSLGADKLFNVFFYQDSGLGTSTAVNTQADFLTKSEQGYKQFTQLGCVNISLMASESVRVSKILVFISNITYFVIGIMLIIRKIILWFLLILSPFLAILMAFKIAKNVGFVWIGTFVKWVFYGPLFALFLGGIAKIWNSGTSIPFLFNFSRRGTEDGFVYPTGINILYGGPNQTGDNRLGFLNTSNYIDTFAEYLISLVMLWVAIVLPWVLLRMLRDFCCDGIYAIKNILMASYDQLKGGSPSPQPMTPLSSLKTSASLKLDRDVSSPRSIKIENIDDIKRANTEEIKQSMQIAASKIADVVSYEMDQSLRSAASKNIEYLKNPMNAQTASQRQQFMNLRSELFDRATKGDAQARQALAAISNSQFEQINQKNEILSSIPPTNPVVVVASVKVGLPKEKVTRAFNSVYKTLVSDESIIGTLSASANISQDKTQMILESVGKSENLAKSAVDLTSAITNDTGIEKAKIKEVLDKLILVIKDNDDFINKVSVEENLDKELVKKLLSSYLPMITEPEKHIEESISIPNNFSIEEYEQIKNMWISNYEKGEVPYSDKISSRKQWIEADIISITNVLNKLFSKDENLKKEALDQISYILPIFMINNFKGQELSIYLKAKLEAAKQTNLSLIREQEISTKIRKDEDLIEIKVDNNNQRPKEMSLEQEIK